MTFTIRSLTKAILLEKAVKDDAVVHFHHKNEADNLSIIDPGKATLTDVGGVCMTEFYHLADVRHST